MASVHKRAGSRVWHMAYRLPNGKRKLVSSGSTDRYEAMRLALAMEAAGKRELTADRAQRLLDEIIRAQDHGNSDPRKATQVIQAYMDANASRWSASTLSNRKGMLEQLKARWGNLTIGALTRQHIATHRDWLLGLGRSPKTVSDHVVFIKTALAEAVPSSVLEVKPPAKTNNHVKQPFTLEQFRKLLDATDGEWHQLILVAGLTGQRLQDCLNLQGEWIKDGIIYFRRKKNKDIYPVPQDARLRGLEGSTGRLFPELGQLPLTGQNSVSAQFRDTILPRIGIVQAYAQDTGGNRKVTEYSFHSLRHMLSTELNAIGVSMETRMRLVGHSDRTVSAGYTHANLDHARAALERISW